MPGAARRPAAARAGRSLAADGAVMPRRAPRGRPALYSRAVRRRQRRGSAWRSPEAGRDRRRRDARAARPPSASAVPSSRPRGDRLEELPVAAALRQRAGQDPVAAHHRPLPPPAVAGGEGGEAGPHHGPAPLPGPGPQGPALALGPGARRAGVPTRGVHHPGVMRAATARVNPVGRGDRTPFPGPPATRRGRGPERARASIWARRVTGASVRSPRRQALRKGLAGGSCPSTSRTLQRPWSTAGALVASPGPGEQEGESRCSNGSRSARARSSSWRRKRRAPSSTTTSGPSTSSWGFCARRRAWRPACSRASRSRWRRSAPR